MKILMFFIIISSSFLGFCQTLSEELDLMPWPKSIEKKEASFLINSSVTISINGPEETRIRNAATNFLRRLTNRTGIFIDEGFPVEGNEAEISVFFKEYGELNTKLDESYVLKVDDKGVVLSATTDVGAIRGLETLLQLTQNNETSYYFPGVNIYDAPRFVWRGLMIDVSRHYQPVNVIKRNLDAMASFKMNVFHWHLTDDQGFRVESKIYPKLQELASDGLYYTQEQIKEVVAYADKLGIRVIPEIDVPGHASAILTAYPELGSKEGYEYAIERYSGVFDPTLNPTKDITYQFLENLFTELAPLFPDEYFHIGGDENEGKHWNENKGIQAFKVKNKLKTNHDLQTYFNIKLEQILNKLDKKLMGWDEIMTPEMPTTAVIHSWRGEHEGLPKGGSLISAAKAGYQTVLSNGYYIDRMLSVDHHYSVDPIGDVMLSDEERARILGGEATMWSELVTPLTIDSRIWPRTAAIAERFWSPQEVNDVDNMKKRLQDINLKLEEIGITHIRNRDVILRNLTDHQDTSPLITLTDICEPLKIYSRNMGGTEYKTFSPFTLFADACTADAKDAIAFNKLIEDYVDKNNDALKNEIALYLNKWEIGFDKFDNLRPNPKLSKLRELYKNLASISSILKENLNGEIDKEKLLKGDILIEKLRIPVEDVELVIQSGLSKLLTYLKSNFKD